MLCLIADEINITQLFIYVIFLKGYIFKDFKIKNLTYYEFLNNLIKNKFHKN